MKLEINLSNLEFHAFHGVLPQEQKTGNLFRVNLSVRIPVNKEIENDDLSGTVSYADLYDIIKEEMSVPRKLLEKVAISISNRIKDKWHQIENGEISIEKITPPVAGITGSASVKLLF